MRKMNIQKILMRLNGNMLIKKMFRDIRKNLSQFITIFLMVMIGVMAYSGIKAYMDGMSKTSETFYTENNLFDLFKFFLHKP